MNLNPFKRISIRTKVVLMIVIMSTIFGSSILGFIYYQLQNTLRDEALNKTLILADGLSVKSAEPVQVEDLNSLQFIQGEAISQPDVAYCFIRDGRGRIISSSFEGNAVPSILQSINLLKPGMPFGTQAATITIRDNVTEVIDIASPIAGGTLGSVHVGLNMTQIQNNIRKLIYKIMMVGGGSLLLLSLITMWGASRTIAPVSSTSS